MRLFLDGLSARYFCAHEGRIAFSADAQAGGRVSRFPMLVTFLLPSSKIGWLFQTLFSHTGFGCTAGIAAMIDHWRHSVPVLPEETPPHRWPRWVKRQQSVDLYKRSWSLGCTTIRRRRGGWTGANLRTNVGILHYQTAIGRYNMNSYVHSLKISIYNGPLPSIRWVDMDPFRSWVRRIAQYSKFLEL
jgi:hypothetical protein